MAYKKRIIEQEITNKLAASGAVLIHRHNFAYKTSDYQWCIYSSIPFLEI
jgi:hypothetical protein